MLARPPRPLAGAGLKLVLSPSPTQMQAAAAPFAAGWASEALDSYLEELLKVRRTAAWPRLPRVYCSATPCAAPPGGCPACVAVHYQRRETPPGGAARGPQLFKRTERAARPP